MGTRINLLICIIFITLLTNSNDASAQVFWDQVCSFAGTNTSYIAVKNSSRLDITGSFALEAWINPANSTSPANQNIFTKRASGSTGYAMALLNGKIILRTNNVIRLVGKTTIPSNTWTHITGRYNSGNGRFSIYINSEADTSVDIASAAPLSNSDSLLIGKGGNSPFEGLMDNIRIWDGVLSTNLLSKIYRSIIATNSGIYDSLVLTMPFQNGNSSSSDFTLRDMTSHDHLTVNRGVTAFQLNSRPSVTTSYNESILLDGDGEYMAAPDNNTVSPTSKITLEAWVYRESVDLNNHIIIHKGNPLALGGTNYQLSMHENSFKAAINGNFSFKSNEFFTGYGRWNHVAFTYNGSNGNYEFFLNGLIMGSGAINAGNVINGNDSLYIGGLANIENFDGYLDEVRITNTVKSIEYIDEYLYKSIEDGNDSAAYTEAVYNFDGYLSSSTDNGPKLYFRNNADFSHPAAIADQPDAPISRSNNFQNGYFLKQESLRIPSAGTFGDITSGFPVTFDDSISDINVFVALNHTQENSLRIVLVSPEGDSCVLFNQNELASESDNIVTVFDSDADSATINLGRYVSINPKIKPITDLNLTYSGKKTKGTWQLKIIDYNTGDIGMLYAWGIQFNNQIEKQKTLSANCLIQGFYNSSSNLTISDSVRCNLRNTFPPYSIIDSSIAILKNTGEANFKFNSPAVRPFTNYYIQLYHRNSIETWSSGYFNMDFFTYSSPGYDFTPDSSQAYGKNMIKVDDTPKEYALYSGDINQDDLIDLNDLLSVYNATVSFSSGYVVNDVTGDNLVDLNDVIIAYNNSVAFVSAEIPDIP